MRHPSTLQCAIFFFLDNDHTWDHWTLSDIVNRNGLAAAMLRVGMLADTCYMSGTQDPAETAGV